MNDDMKLRLQMALRDADLSRRVARVEADDLRALLFEHEDFEQGVEDRDDWIHPQDHDNDLVDNYETGREEGYQDGYCAGFDDGVDEGMQRARLTNELR